MEAKKLRKFFLDYFKKNGHKIVVSSSLIPNDESVLLTTAGMQQFVPYLSGKIDVLRDFKTNHLCSIQKCFRTPDIDEVGDDTHHTFFEMLGNWSIGQDKKNKYFKEGAIELALDFFVNELDLDKDKLWITIFKGENNISKDKESFEIWQKQGIPKERIQEFGLKDNFWGPTAETGPCGPSSEIHYDRGKKYGCKVNCGPNCQKCNRFVELWNLVFMEFDKKIKKEQVPRKREQKSKIKIYEYNKLPQKNIDTGIGFERLLSVLDNKDSGYETDLFVPIIKKLEKITDKKYEGYKKEFRIIADHIRGSVFLISDKVLPSNLGKGYILRRILRRAIRYGNIIKAEKNFLNVLVEEVIKNYKDFYPEIESNKDNIIDVIKNEEEKFEKTLEKGIKQFQKIIKENKIIKGKDIFYLYETHGFPLELTEEIAKEKGIKIDKKGFEEALKKHQQISRAGVEKKFGGVGKSADYQSTKLHTTTHLLHQALRDVLGSDVQQMGSDINSERLRFDFSYTKKMTDEEIKKVENIVNQKIEQDLEVKKEEMSYDQAIKSGALAFFKEKYPEKVNVYSVGLFSKEICAGPHVKKTFELGKFEIIKEQSSGAGIRRIKAVLKK
ncbi:MAG: alanine--tRNA ligase [Candidatus Nealsonbacteria bacterium]